MEDVWLHAKRFIREFYHLCKSFFAVKRLFEASNSERKFLIFPRYSCMVHFHEPFRIARDTFKLLAERGVKVMLSNSDCDFVRELYSDFRVHEVLAARAINSKVEKRGKITELLVTSY